MLTLRPDMPHFARAPSALITMIHNVNVYAKFEFIQAQISQDAGGCWRAGGAVVRIGWQLRWLGEMNVCLILPR
jgi:hypothetical protein